MIDRWVNHHHDWLVTVITKVELVYPEAWRLIEALERAKRQELIAPEGIDLNVLIRQHLMSFPGADSGVIIDLEIKKKRADL